MNIEEAIKLLKQPPDFSLRYYERENAIDIVLNELNKKDKVIDIMAEQLANYKYEELICMEVDCKHIELQNEGKCIGDKNCIKEYFYNKVK